MVTSDVHLQELIRSYDMRGVSLELLNDFPFIEVPGLAERRPSPLHGDNISVTYVGTHAQTYKVSNLSLMFEYLFVILKGQI